MRVGDSWRVLPWNMLRGLRVVLACIAVEHASGRAHGGSRGWGGGVGEGQMAVLNGGRCGANGGRGGRVWSSSWGKGIVVVGEGGQSARSRSVGFFLRKRIFSDFFSPSDTASTAVFSGLLLLLFLRDHGPGGPKQLSPCVFHFERLRSWRLAHDLPAWRGFRGPTTHALHDCLGSNKTRYVQFWRRWNRG